MKKNLIILMLLVLPFSGFGKCDLPEEAEQLKCSKPIKTYVKAFTKAVNDHDQKAIMRLLHPEYVAQQHDDFLEGRTMQFISELLMTPLEKVKKIKFCAYYKWRDMFWVQFRLKTTEKEIKIRQWGIDGREDDSSFQYGIWGAVG